MSKREMSPERRRVVVMCAAVGAMSGGPILLKGHPVWLGVWIAVMATVLVVALTRLAKLKKEGL